MEFYQQQTELIIRYESILLLEAKHDFFGAEPTEIFVWHASTQTQKMLQQLGVITKQSKDQLRLLQSSEYKDSLIYLLENTSNLQFTFYLHTNNPAFRLFTELPIKSNSPEILYYSNENQKKIAPDALNLTQTDYASSKDILPTIANTLNIKAKKQAKYQVTDGKKQVFLEQVAQNEQLNIALSNLSEGKYTLLEDNKTLSHFVNISPEHATKALAIVQIFINDELKKQILQALKDQQTLPVLQYDLRFNCRKTWWKYIIVPQYMSNANQLTIDTNDKSINFSEVKTITLPNGQQGYAFEAEQPLPLTKNYNYNFQLYKKSKGTASLFIQKLPFPNIESIRPQKENNKGEKKYYSDIIVYL